MKGDLSGIGNVLREPGSLRFVGFTLPGGIDPSIAIAASKAGGIGILDLEFATDPKEALKAVSRMARHAGKECGVKLGVDDDGFVNAVANGLPENVRVVVFSWNAPGKLNPHIQAMRLRNRLVVLEVVSVEQAIAGEGLGADGIIAKGRESGGLVGEKTAFILLQQVAAQTSLPVWVRGGVGVHSSAACYAAGASGVVLDSQLALLRESPLPGHIKRVLHRMDGSETVCIGDKDAGCRMYNRPRTSPEFLLHALDPDISAETGENDPFNAWRAAIRGRISWQEAGEAIWLVGQDAAFAATFAERYGTVGSLFQSLRRAVRDHVRSAKKAGLLREGSPLARLHGTAYPIVQGPMARVSDKAPFLSRVADGGALPFVAISQMRPEEITSLLSEVEGLLGNRPWGVGLLGFLEGDFLQAQLRALEPFSPKFAIVAGAQPGQVAMLESKGVSTYAHVPSPALLDMFVEAGARRFIFEGNECGGHIGPRSSFVLWETMIDRLMETFRAGHKPEEFQILFAGGIHDSLSAVSVATMAAPLSAQGVNVGILMGTAYFFTQEITETAAITREYQNFAVRCSATRVLETGPGHALRCCDTPFARNFEGKKQQLRNEKRSPEDIRDTLEKFVLGRSRIAAKGLVRNPAIGVHHGEPAFLPVPSETQQAEGLYLIGQLAALQNRVSTIGELHRDVVVGAAERLEELVEPADEQEGRTGKSSDIAIVGMSCFFPKTKNLREYWENILGKVNAITEVPKKRWDLQIYFDADKKVRDKIYTRWGGFLDDMPFDPTKYGIPPNSIRSIEPLHLMTLEMVGAALKDAGYEGREFPREKTSVIIGTGSGIGELGQKYILRSLLPEVFEIHSPDVMKRLTDWTEDTFPGILMNVLAGRVANRFNLGGVNYTIDAACASSLAALYDAARELEMGNSDMVIVGGAEACQNPFTYTAFSKTNALSPTGACRVFDEKADGTVISEGLAFLVLKRLQDAERDGDRVYAVIKAVAGSSDGRAMGMTAPRAEGQLLALKRAYAKAGFPPAAVDLFEAHGTGTAVGDVVEAESLTRLLRESGAAPQTSAVGSVKSTIGHTKGTAGLAGLIKVALSLYHNTLPPTMGVEKPNPKIDFLKGPLYINTETRPWIGDGCAPRRAGVSAFGFGGTNFHAVLEQYCSGIAADRTAVVDSWPAELLLWTGRTREEIVSELNSLRQRLEKGARPLLRDMAFTLHGMFRETSRKTAENLPRLAIIASSPEDLKEKLSIAARILGDGSCGTHSDPKGIFFSQGRPSEAGKIAFLFPGQGSQYPNMLRDLAVIFPEVLGSFERANAVLRERFPEKLSSYIFPPPRFTAEQEAEQKKKLANTNIAQPALGAACWGMWNLLRNFSLSPDMTAGHSYGEYVALAAAGVFDEDTLYAVSEARGRLMIEAAKGNDLGTMAAVSASASEVRGILGEIDGVVIANVNSPRQTVISGMKDAIERAIGVLRTRGLHAQTFSVAAAFHSPAVAPAKQLFSDFLKTVAFAEPCLEVFSNTHAAPYGRSREDVKACLAEHIVKPVEFVREIEAMYEKGARIFIEVGPGSVLTNLTRQILEGKSFLALATDLQGQPALTQLLKTLGQLLVQNVPLSLERLYGGRNLQHVEIQHLGDKAQEKYSPTTWLVNGSGITHPSRERKPRDTTPSQAAYRLRERRNLLEMKRDGERQVPVREEPGPTVRPTIQEIAAAPPVSPSGESSAGPFPQQGTDADAVMLQYQALMTRFLETQQSVMMAYLQGNPQVVPTKEVESPLLRDQIHTSHRGFETKPQDSDAVERERSTEGAGREIATVEAVGSGWDMERLKGELLRVAGERTGYPAEMLDLNLDMEAELGIDSIKRVEILGAFLKSLPPAVQERLQPVMEDLRRLKTLKAILDKTSGTIALSQPGPAGIVATSSPGEAASRNGGVEDLKGELLRVAGERTGYPAEMLDLNLDMEAELGIDSIKRVEILGAFIKSLPPAVQERLQPAMEDLRRLKTLKAILDKTSGMIAKDLAGPREELPSPDHPRGALSGRDNGDEGLVPRFLLETVASPGSGDALKIPVDGVFIVTGDNQGVADILAGEIRRRGGRAVLLGQGDRNKENDSQTVSVDLSDPSAVGEAISAIRKEYGKIVGLVHMRPLGKSLAFEAMSLKDWNASLKSDVKGFYYLAKALGSDLKGAGKDGGSWLIAATSLAGDPGLNGNSFVGHAGLSGLMKTVAQEWPEVVCRVVHLDPSGSPATHCEQLLSEMATRKSPAEVIYRGTGRLVYQPLAAPLNKESGETMRIGKDWVILITGGAMGITSEVAKEIASRFKPTLILLGRSALPGEESPAVAGLSSQKDVKEALIQQARLSGGTPSPMNIEASYARLLKDREMRKNIAELRQTGAAVHYYQADVRDEKNLGDLVGEIYRTFGRLDGIIHGAGIVEDKLLEDKQPDSFDRVFDTKTESAFILSRIVKSDSLKFIVFFTSVSGCFGNRGQSDYAAANEIVNKLAIYLDRQWSGRVMAINWGPWKKIGMVSPAVEKQFNERGVQLIPPETGCRMMIEELRYGKKGDVEVVIGNGPWMT